MLSHLNIRDLALIQSLSLDLSDGLNIITGETGAGKSILIKALSFLLGGRASGDYVRSGAAQAIVTAVFQLHEKHPAWFSLAEAGLVEGKPGEDGVIIRRSVSSKGRSQAWINDQPVTLSTLRSIAADMVDIFGQHEHHKILDPLSHTQYLDLFLQADSKHKLDYDEAYASLQTSLKSLQTLITDFEQQCRDRDYLEFRIDEMRRFNPDAEEYKELLSKSRNIKDLSKRLEKIRVASEIIDGSNGRDAMGSQIRQVIQILSQLENELPAVQGLEAAAETLDELSYQLGRFGEELNESELDMDQIEDRVGTYQDMMRKFQVETIEQLLEQQKSLEERFQLIDGADVAVRSMLDQVEKAMGAVKKRGNALSKARKSAARELQSAVESELHELNMPNARFAVAFQSIDRILPSIHVGAFGVELEERWSIVADQLTEWGESGGERVSFTFSANAGESLKALQKVASGGEVSRIMLAIKRALAVGADTCLLVFDEIDTGISGQVADTVGLKLRGLAKGFQVICISHLAQVAAYADAHFLVAKKKIGNRTESSITRLSTDESQQEIARLISSADVTKRSLANAKEIIKRARERAH